jgi:sulfide:quinone oxidoreductase
MSEHRADERPEVLIVGGGIAGLEALIALRDLAGERVSLTLVAPDLDFSYKPLTVEEPFTFRPAERRALAPVAEEFDARLIQQAVVGLRPQHHTAQLADGSELSYDAAVVCVGARQRPAYSDAITFGASGEELEIDRVLKASAGEEPPRIAFVVPPGVTWPLPLYELALMSRRRAEELRLYELEILVVTPESAPLIMFGPLASEAVTELLGGRRIQVVSQTWVTEADDGHLTTKPGKGTLEAGRVVALPVLEGPAIAGLPADEHGFMPIDQHARIVGVQDVYAAGDGTTFPIKQGGLGTQQADAAAEDIAARFGAGIEPQPFHPVLRGKLLTGAESLNLRADVAGGAGEGTASADYLWWPPHKVSGRYLAAWLAGEKPRLDPDPPRHALEVEVQLPKEWHREPMALDPYGPLTSE